MLARTLGLPEAELTQTEGLAKPAVQPWWPLRADLLSAPVNELPMERATIEEEDTSLQILGQGETALDADLQDLSGVDNTDLPAQPAQADREPSAQPAVEAFQVEAEKAELERAPQARPARAKETQPPTRSGLAQPVRARVTEFRDGTAPPSPSSFTEENEAQRGEDVSDKDIRESLPAAQSARELSTMDEYSMPPTASKEQHAAQTAAELFAPRDTDRSPQAWLARLNKQAQRERQQETRSASTSASLVPRAAQARQSGRRKASSHPSSVVRNARHAEPAAQSARMFLKPLLGIDPASVPVYRDAQAEEEAARERADALSDGETIAMAPEHSAQTPETLGLLAHELTHVARSQNPRFVPPIVRVESSALAPSWETSDEEALALQVERQTRQVARSAQAPVIASVGVTGAVHSPGESAHSEHISSAPDPARPIWGSLPAPWEPLPDWLAPSPPAQIESPQPEMEFSTASGNAAMPVAPSLSAPITFAPGESRSERTFTSAFRRAGLERSSEAPGEGTESLESAASSPAAAHAPEPDLDALARQVYDLLKRRLSVEQRREL